jgi:hypothetical protein
MEATIERLIHAANDTTIVDATIDRAGEKALKTRRFRDSQIERMFAAKRITQSQLDAALWYLERYAEAGISGRVTANYSASGGGEARCLGTKLLGSERQYQARQKWREARGAIPTNMLVIVDAVVLENILPPFINSRQRERYADQVGRALQPLASWLGY